MEQINEYTSPEKTFIGKRTFTDEELLHNMDLFFKNNTIIFSHRNNRFVVDDILPDGLIGDANFFYKKVKTYFDELNIKISLEGKKCLSGINHMENIKNTNPI